MNNYDMMRHGWGGIFEIALMQINKIEISILGKICKLTKLKMKTGISFCIFFYLFIVKLLEFFQSSSIRVFLYHISSVLIVPLWQPLKKKIPVRVILFFCCLHVVVRWWSVSCYSYLSSILFLLLLNKPASCLRRICNIWLWEFVLYFLDALVSHTYLGILCFLCMLCNHKSQILYQLKVNSGSMGWTHSGSLLC